MIKFIDALHIITGDYTIEEFNDPFTGQMELYWRNQESDDPIIALNLMKEHYGISIGYDCCCGKAIERREAPSILDDDDVLNLCALFDAAEGCSDLWKSRKQKWQYDSEWRVK